MYITKNNIFVRHNKSNHRKNDNKVHFFNKTQNLILNSRLYIYVLNVGR